MKGKTLKQITNTSKTGLKEIPSLPSNEDFTIDLISKQSSKVYKINVNELNSATDSASALFPNGLDVIEESRDFQSSDEGKLLVLFPGANLTMPDSIVFTGLFKTIGIMRLDTTSWFEQEFGGTKIKSLTTTEFKHNEIVLCLTSVTDDDSASRLLFSSTTIIEEQTALKYLYDQSQNVIPLSGTATLSSGTVTVTTDKIKTGYKIYLSVNTPSGTQGFLSAPTGSIVDETEFVINSTSATDDSTVNWWIAP